MPRVDVSRIWMARSSRWWLVGSLILNVSFFTAAIGRAVHSSLEPPRQQSTFGSVLTQARAVLSPNDLKAFLAAIHRDAPDFDEADGKLAEARRTVLLQIASPRFDQSATRSALINLRARWTTFSDEFREPLIQALAEVSPDGRRRLVSPSRLQPPAVCTDGRQGNH